MKLLLIIASFFSFSFCLAQSEKFQVGDTWSYGHSFVRDSSYWESKYAIPMDSIYPVEIHTFNYHEGLAKVVYNEQVGFIDSSMTILIPLIYENKMTANKFIMSRSSVVKDGKWGVIDTSGATVFPFIYDEIKRYDDLYYVSVKYDWGYLDSDGHTILPMRDYRRSHIMTKEEIHDLAHTYQQKDSLENSVSVSKDDAISIAKSKGYFFDYESWPFIPSVDLSEDKSHWIIQSTERKGTTRKGKCASTNGCIVQVKYQITIDSSTAKIKQKSRNKILIPVYE